MAESKTWFACKVEGCLGKPIFATLQSHNGTVLIETSSALSVHKLLTLSGAWKRNVKFQANESGKSFKKDIYFSCFLFSKSSYENIKINQAYLD